MTTEHGEGAAGSDWRPEILDVTAALRTGMPVWPGDPGFRIRAVAAVAGGAAVSEIRLGTHTGTHIDAPAHVLAGGAPVEDLDLGVMIGPALVVHAGAGPELSLRDLPPEGTTRVLYRTRNSGAPRGSSFDPDYAALGPELAAELVWRGVRLVGVDGPSIERFDAPGLPVHHVLLEAGVVVIEGLDLSAVEPGPYEMVCLPLPLEGADGAPARVVLRPLSGPVC